ncbi:MAG TPA: sulfoxide reductase heme-binding subunit YedZ [Gammaproteobacteria bacterium]|jgi:sulfoxide reductase heme-binding subunit YedZ|nr:protein-methionine-sulfoxide reductase heme-binding subunit MsrQ [Gammaproteobacteria bacterium]MDP6734048.1 protein-methionine-sulfoxide reductase heme-binding subunit MsrQ [Gammaproteobacteria bacterium]HAJ74944.1 sulfoxide reductase heme-binding subunit YedZ [Gammaproteobacteria bacterium]|tara:strand:+ start:2331 stop:2927 length:597 start_codon:yes stop_codon:yes gene_type:complete
MAKLIKPSVLLIALLPFCMLLLRIVRNDLGPDPAQELSIETGEWTLRFLLITLAMTPLRQITGQIIFVKYRRMLGLFTLFYGSVHFISWMTFLLGFRWFAIAEELIERPYISVGFSAFLILVALGVTSPKSMVRRLGKNWKRLHRLVYLAAVLGVIHLLWILRADSGEAVLYGSILAGLLGYRLLRFWWIQNNAGKTS